MTPTRKRARVAAAAMTAVLAMASVFALAAPASADAVGTVAVTNVTATGGEGKATVSWTPPSTGGTPDSYVVFLFNSAGTLVSTTIVPAPASSATVEIGAGTYTAGVATHNVFGTGAIIKAPGTAVVTAKVVPDQVTTVNTDPWRPYASWTAMLNKEFQMFTGCGSMGRLPRDDEKTYWLAYFTAPFSWTDWNSYNGFYTVRRASEWMRLTNGATWDNDTVISDTGYTSVPGLYPPVAVASNVSYKNSIAYKALYADGVTDGNRRVTQIAGVYYATADLTANGGNQDGVVSAAEIASYANNWARYSVNLQNKYGAAVNTLADTQAKNDVLFMRRGVMKAQLAENAAQLDGPAYRLYTAYFRRIPDFNGLCFWSNKLKSGWSLLDVSEFFVKSSEFKNTYGEYSTHGEEGATDAAEFVALVYNNVLNRYPDGQGTAFWTRQLQTERYSPAEMMIGFSESQEYKNKMETRVNIGIAFAHLLGRMPTQSEYVLADSTIVNIWGDTGAQFTTTPESRWVYSTWNDYLYGSIVDSAEYIARAKA